MAINPDNIIKLAQLSDPHLYADHSQELYGLNTFDCFRLVVAEVSKRSTDLTLVTGDLVHDESELGYKVLREGLNELTMPVHLIPGNHDNIGLMQAEFDRGQINCGKQIQIGDWQIILLNSHVPGKVAGHLDDLELRWLEQCLSNCSVSHSMIFLHHHPVSVGNKWLDPIGLDNADQLFELIAASEQVKALVWGHVHQECDEKRAGVRLMSAPSTCIQFKPGTDDFALDDLAPGYRWFELYPDGRLESGVERLAEIPDGLDPAATGYRV